MNRRDFLHSAGGALVISFGLPLTFEAIAQPKPDPRMSMLDTWLEIDADGKVTVFTGKVELGTGIETALAQLIADELDVRFDRVKLVMGDTLRCPDQIATVGSLTVYRAGPQLRRAAAEARVALTEMAATRLGTDAAKLTTDMAP